MLRQLYHVLSKHLIVDFMLRDRINPPKFIFMYHNTITMENTTVNVTENLKIIVCAGVYGRYLKLKRETKWISLSEKCWKFINNNLKMIDRSLRDEVTYSIAITSAKDVRVSMYNERPYVTFRERYIKNDDESSTEEGYKHINLDSSEWSALKLRIGEINSYFDLPIVYKSKDNSSWSFVKPKCCKDIKVDFWYDLEDDDVNIIMYVYLVRKQILNLLGESHMNAKEPKGIPYFDKNTDKLFNSAKRDVNYYEYIGKLNRTVDWKVSPWFLLKNDEEIKDIIKGSVAFKPELMSMLFDLFEHLEF